MGTSGQGVADTNVPSPPRRSALRRSALRRGAGTGFLVSGGQVPLGHAASKVAHGAGTGSRAGDGACAVAGIARSRSPGGGEAGGAVRRGGGRAHAGTATEGGEGRCRAGRGGRCPLPGPDQVEAVELVTLVAPSSASRWVRSLAGAAPGAGSLPAGHARPHRRGGRSPSWCAPEPIARGWPRPGGECEPRDGHRGWAAGGFAA